MCPVRCDRSAVWCRRVAARSEERGAAEEGRGASARVVVTASAARQSAAASHARRLVRTSRSRPSLHFLCAPAVAQALLTRGGRPDPRPLRPPPDVHHRR